MDIDLNSDLGEGCLHDNEILDLVTSANISCGFHAGDASTVRQALQQARIRGVRTGAHPGYADRENFGRIELDLDPQAILDLLCQQIGALLGLARQVDQPITHLKPHGALYNQACREDRFARPVIDAALLFDLPVLGLPGSRLEALCLGKCRFIPEGFADRRYLPDGSLVSRTRPDAFVENPGEAVSQAEWLIRERGVRTLCVHGDHPRALAFVKALREELTGRGLEVRAFG